MKQKVNLLRHCVKCGQLVEEKYLGWGYVLYGVYSPKRGYFSTNCPEGGSHSVYEEG